MLDLLDEDPKSFFRLPIKKVIEALDLDPRSDFRDDKIEFAEIKKDEVVNFNFNKSEFRSVVFEVSSFNNCDFTSAKFSEVQVQSCNFNSCVFLKSDLSGGKFQGNTFRNCIMSGLVYGDDFIEANTFLNCKGIKAGLRKEKKYIIQKTDTDLNLRKISQVSAETQVPKLFGFDGIRGEVNHSPMTAELALKLGMAIGLALDGDKLRRRVVIGKDTRLSGYMIENALISGFTSVGFDVFQLGPVPISAVAMLTKSLRTDLGVMISAAHFPHQYNGIRFFGADGYKLSEKVEKKTEEILNSDFSARLAPAKDLGRVKRIDAARQRYVELAKRTMPKEMNLDGLRVVVDCANGAAYKVVPEALWELGAEVISIGNLPDGLNINLNCGAHSTEALKNKVHEVRADIGIAMDGDADTMKVVDETGSVVDGDQLLAVLAQAWQARNRLSAPGVVATVLSNLGLERYLNGLGLSLARTKVGDRFVIDYMRANGFNVGGEQSGHFFLSDFSTTGDGLIAALQVLACIKGEERPASEVCRRFEPVPQVLKNVHFTGHAPLDAELVKLAISDGEARLGQSGRLVIGASGAEQLIRVLAEGDDADLVKQVVNDIIGVVSTAVA